VDDRYWFPLLLAAVVIAGCAATTQTNVTQVVRSTASNTPIPDYTFSTPHYVSTVTPVLAMVTTTPNAPVSFSSDTNDPIIGDWRLVGANYPCDAVFGHGDGHVTCVVFEHSTFTWMKDNRTEYSLSDTAGHNVVLEMGINNDTLTSDVFPNNSYLQKVGY
jgi:hypothetical protein